MPAEVHGKPLERRHVTARSARCHPGVELAICDRDAACAGVVAGACHDATDLRRLPVDPAMDRLPGRWAAG